MKSSELRQKYLKFFEKRGHKIIPSASLVPPESVELTGIQRVLFTTAGMHPLVPFLLGQPHPEGKRLVNVQRCLRTDDIDQVGDSVHNTFFEMLGNWSLGDYWKEEAISWSWEFLIKELKLDSKRIYVSVFSGDKDAPFDEESFNIWKKLGVSQDHIFKYGKDQNWWGPVGPVGPCGPDTEMFYDLTPDKEGKIDPAKNPNRFIEIWNDVFMEYDKKIKNQKEKFPKGNPKIKNIDNLNPDDFEYVPLKQKNVDTGMGLERMLMVLQNVQSVYDTDLFEEAMKRIRQKSTNLEPHYARKIADHIRSTVFLIADGVQVLSRDERGSVLTRLLNNSLSYLRQVGIDHSYASYIAEAFIKKYEGVYPEVKETREKILNKISLQEERYLRNEKVREALLIKEVSPIAHVDEPGRRRIIESTATTISGTRMPYKDLQKNYPSLATTSGTVGAVSAQLKQTYGISVEDAIRVTEKVITDIEPEKFTEGYKAMMDLHSKRAKKVGEKTKGGLAVQSDQAAKLHTATHLLHQALRDVLGHHVHQTGSHITEERLRFDFTHSEKLTDEQIKKVENIVNEKIKENLKVNKKTMPKETADKLGAIGLFAEKYKDLVNVYYIGSSNDINNAYSKEFCGGPHAVSTGVLGEFKIIKEESAGANIRRIYATISR